jgi:hypothetical protein
MTLGKLPGTTSVFFYKTGGHRDPVSTWAFSGQYYLAVPSGQYLFKFERYGSARVFPFELTSDILAPS